MTSDLWKLERHDRMDRWAKELGFVGIADALEILSLIPPAVIEQCKKERDDER